MKHHWKKWSQTDDSCTHRTLNPFEEIFTVKLQQGRHGKKIN